MNKKVKFSILWGVDLSKGILFLLALVTGIKIILTPGNDSIDIIMWRLAIISIIVIPLVILCCTIYGLSLIHI